MKVTPLELPELLLIEPYVYADERGYFTEGWQDTRYAAHGIAGPFVQDNLSFSRRAVLRGLHYQWPRAQGKLVSVLQGTVWDVAVDVRQDSPSFGRWVALELSEENHRQLWVPPGYAHGFVVLSETALFLYKVTAPYTPGDEVTLAWNDPAFGITWPVVEPKLAPRDAAAPSFRDLPPDRVARIAIAR